MSPFEYTCLCEPGYTDPICATDIDECVNTTCPQNSNCVDEVNSYSCVCLNGFEGPQCNVSTLTSAGVLNFVCVLIASLVLLRSILYSNLVPRVKIFNFHEHVIYYYYGISVHGELFSRVVH